MELSELIAQNLEDNRSKLVNLGLFLDNKGGEGGLEDGTNYILVKATGTPEENASHLHESIIRTVDMPRYLGTKSFSFPYVYKKGQTFLMTGDRDPKFYKVNVSYDYATAAELIDKTEISQEEAESVRLSVVCTPGIYDFKNIGYFYLENNNVDLVSLTGNPDVVITGTNIFYSENLNVHIRGISFINVAFDQAMAYNSFKFENCIFNSNCFNSEEVGYFVSLKDCVFNGSAFSVIGDLDDVNITGCTFNASESGLSTGRYIDCVFNEINSGNAKNSKYTNCKFYGGYSGSGEDSIYRYCLSEANNNFSGEASYYNDCESIGIECFSGTNAKYIKCIGYSKSFNGTLSTATNCYSVSNVALYNASFEGDNMCLYNCIAVGNGVNYIGYANLKRVNCLAIDSVSGSTVKVVDVL